MTVTPNTDVSHVTSRVTWHQKSRDGHAHSTPPHHTVGVLTSVGGCESLVQIQSFVSKGSALGLGAKR